MSYTSGMFNRELNDFLYDNVETTTQPLTETNYNLLASLGYVQDYFSSIIGDYLPVNNPVFTGSLTSISGNINVPTGTITNATLPTATITTANITNQNGTLFNQNPSITINSKNYQVSFRIVGEIKMLTTNAVVPNYLNCDGSSYSTTAYPALFTAIGYAYGGSGASFNVPNFASRFPIGNNGSLNGVPSSNYATGNGAEGLTNTQLITYNFSNYLQNQTALLLKVPEHAHETTFEQSVPSTITPLGVQTYLYDSGSFAGTDTLTIGQGIQGVDPISDDGGVNITPSYIAVAYFICYQ